MKQKQTIPTPATSPVGRVHPPSLVLGALLICLFMMHPAQAMDDSPGQKYLRENIEHRNFDKAIWEKAIKGINFAIGEKTPGSVANQQKGEGRGGLSSRDRQEKAVKQQALLFGGKTGALLLKAFILITAVTLLVLLLRALLGMEMPILIRKTARKKAPPEVDIQTIEKDIHQFDLPFHIGKAIERGDYALALRLNYLLVLKKLSSKRWIKWKKDKTNGDYYNDLNNSPWQQPFQEITRIFERTWYGEMPFDKKHYSALIPLFSSLIRDIENSRGPGSNQSRSNRHEG